MADVSGTAGCRSFGVLAAEVAKAFGRVEPEFALALALLMSEFEAVAQRLGAAGYRPGAGVRPYLIQAVISVAAWSGPAMRSPGG